jgi:hypothetical protein
MVGYDTGVISGALVTINGDLGPTELSSGQKVGTNIFSTRPDISSLLICLGIDNFGYNPRCSHWWISCWNALRLRWTETRARYFGCHLHRWCCWPGRLSYCVVNGENHRRPVSSCSLTPSDWLPFPHRYWCWSCLVHRTSVHPRVVSHAPKGTHGCVECCHDHWRTGGGVWYR